MRKTSLFWRSSGRGQHLRWLGLPLSSSLFVPEEMQCPGWFRPEAYALPPELRENPYLGHMDCACEKRESPSGSGILLEEKSRAGNDEVSNDLKRDAVAALAFSWSPKCHPLTPLGTLSPLNLQKSNDWMMSLFLRLH